MQIFDMLEEFDEALDWGALDDPLLADHLPAVPAAGASAWAAPESPVAAEVA